ncbi:MAG: M3 family oligoendopeptidase [Erysipelotrichaceae bacterium]|nr:M3 family oligoendopeptidase [Erysipelotrichaceae bacterium]
MRWSLKELYESFEDVAFVEDLKLLDQKIEEFGKWVNESVKSDNNPAEVILRFIRYSEEITTYISKLSQFANLTSATDARNEVALDFLNQLNVKSTALTQPSVVFQTYLKGLDSLNHIIDSSSELKEYAFYLDQIKLRSQYMLSEKEEVAISKLTTTGSTAWSNLQNKLSSTLMVEVDLDGEKLSLPLPAVRNFAYSEDIKKRVAGYLAEMEAYKKIEESSAAALNGIKGEVVTLCELRGYESALEETLIKSRMDKETLDAMLTAMRESLPAFRKYLRRKAELLGHGNGLPFYDMFAPMGEVNMTYTYPQAMDFIITQFRTFSDKLADFTQNAYDHAWLDVEPREGKRGGAFCANLHGIKESRILSNFSGSFSNMTTLAHELGHAYHGTTLIDESVLNSRYPMPIAETASIFCETIVVNAALKNASREEQLAILESSISDSTQVIVDIYSRFLFESALFDQRKNSVVSVAKLKELMISAQKEAYGDGLDQNLLHSYMWVNKPHYYSAGLNFYNFPYAFGLLFSKGLYAEYLKRGDEFVEQYDELLNATGKELVADVAMRMNVDVRNPDFFRSSLALIEKDIDKFIELSK